MRSRKPIECTPSQSHQPRWLERWQPWLLGTMVAVCLVPMPAIAQSTLFSGSLLSSPVTQALDRAASLLSASEHLVAQAEADDTVNAEITPATLADLLANAEQPTTQPQVIRTVVDGNYALATWQWGDAGGQSVLSQANGEWQVLSSGGGLVDAQGLEDLGVPSDIAQRLVEQDQSAWEKPNAN